MIVIDINDNLFFLLEESNALNKANLSSTNVPLDEENVELQVKQHTGMKYIYLKIMLLKSLMINFQAVQYNIALPLLDKRIEISWIN